jgi:hypothetical protein
MDHRFGFGGVGRDSAFCALGSTACAASGDDPASDRIHDEGWSHPGSLDSNELDLDAEGLPACFGDTAKY